MSERRQAVHLEATTSETRLVGPRSVIQGSTLSCLMYLIYIMDIPTSFHDKPHSPLNDFHCHRPTVTTYVDDFNTTITTPKNNPQLMNKLLHENLRQTKSYMNANKLALNEDKTKIFIITKHPDRKDQVKLQVSDKIISHTKTINVLGVKINEKLTWNNHLIQGDKSLAQQIRQRMTVIRNLRKLTTIKFAKILATSLVMSKIEYAIALWGNAPKYMLDIIQKLLNKTARIVIGPTSARWSVRRLMNTMGWLTIKDLFIYHQSCLIHQVIITGSPEYLKERIVTGRTGITRSFAYKKLGPKPREIGSSMFTKNTFVATSFAQYDSLPGEITSIPVRSIFKRRLKRFLINNDDIPNRTDKLFGRYLTSVLPPPTDRARMITDTTSCPPDLVTPSYT